MMKNTNGLVRLPALVAALTLASLLGSHVSAQDAAAPDRIARARAAYDEGAAAFNEGRFGEALDRFSEAYDLSARAELLYNIATSHDRLGRRDNALSNYRAYLDALPDANNRAYTEARMEVLEREIAEQQALRDARPPLVETEVEPDPEPVDPVRVDPPSSGPNVAAIGLLAGAGAVGVAAVITGVLALGQRSDLETSCPTFQCDGALQGDIDRLRTLSITTDVLIGVAAAAAIAGVVLFIVGGGDDDEASVACGLSGCNARIPF